MSPIVPNNRSLNDMLSFPPAIGRIEIPLSIRISIDPIASAVKWVWNVVVLNIRDDWMPLTLLFMSATGIFPIWPSIAIAVTSTFIIYSSISTARSSALYRANLHAENQRLQDQNHLLIDQRGELQIRYNAVSRERNDLIQEHERFSIEIRELIDNRTQIAIERNRLADEIQHLREQENANQNQNSQLVQQRDAAEERKKQLEEQCRNNLREVGELRAMMGQVDAYTKLHETLERFHDLYQQVIGGQEDQEGPLKFAHERLIPQYQVHRAKLHEMLKTSIALLEPDDLNRIPLAGILRISEQEMRHIERISKTINLLREFRAPLIHQLQQNINNPAGEM